MITNFRTYEMAIALYKECKSVKADRNVRDQLQRASLSVVRNLAEGAGRQSAADKRRLYAIAYGSIREVQALCRLLERKDLFAQSEAIGAAAYRLMKNTN